MRGKLNIHILGSYSVHISEVIMTTLNIVLFISLIISFILSIISWVYLLCGKSVNYTALYIFEWIRALFSFLSVLLGASLIITL